VNAIWYMMLLGSNAGWDLPNYQILGDNNDQEGADPVLQSPYPHGRPPLHNAGCNGNGSTSGQLEPQTLSQRLMMAQQNLRHVTAAETDVILEDIRALKHDAKAASRDGDVEIDLTSPLREAAKLIERAKSPGRPNREGSVSATTPTHLMELFVQRAQRHTPDLGQSRTEILLTEAYRLIAKLEGQNQPGKATVARGSR
jgi:hypothetical protein